MTDKTDREIMRQSLEVLVQHVKHYDYEQFTSVCELEPAKDLILVLCERLAQPEQKPVTAQHRFRYPQNARFWFRHPEKTIPDWSKWQECKVSNRPAWEIDSRGYEVEYRNLYTAPPERQPLTYAEMKKIADEHLKSEYQPASYEMSGVFDLIRAVEYTKLKEMK